MSQQAQFCAAQGTATVTVASLTVQFIQANWEEPGALPRIFNKAQLAYLSFVCRAWSSCLRPLIFERITLRSAEDARAFLATLSSSSQTRFRECIQELKLECTTLPTRDDPLWFYAFFASRPNLPTCDMFMLSIKPPSRASHSNLSIKLPRSLPNSMTRCHYFFVGDCRVRSFLDLLTFCGIVGGYGTLNCRKLLWNDSGITSYTDLLKGLRSPHRHIFQELLIYDCTNPWIFIWLFFTTTPRGQRHTRWKKSYTRYICVGEMKNLERLAQQSLPLQYGTRKITTYRFEIDDGEYINKSLSETRWLISATDKSNSSTTVLRMQHESPRTDGPVIEVSVSCITGLIDTISLIYEQLEFVDEQLPLLIRDPHPISSYCWENLDGVIAEFGGSLLSVCVRIRTNKDHMDSFRELILPRVPLTKLAGKLDLFYAEPLEGYSWHDDLTRDFWRFEWKKMV